MDIKEIEKRIIEVAKKKSGCEYSELSCNISFDKLSDKLEEFREELAGEKDASKMKDSIVSVILESVLLANLSGVDLEVDIQKKFDSIFEKIRRAQNMS